MQFTCKRHFLTAGIFILLWYNEYISCFQAVSLLAMVSAFGLTGASMATPLAAIIKPYYEDFMYVNSSKIN